MTMQSGDKPATPYTPEFNRWWESLSLDKTATNRRKKAWAWHGWCARIEFGGGK